MLIEKCGSLRQLIRLNKTKIDDLNISSGYKDSSRDSRLLSCPERFKMAYMTHNGTSTDHQPLLCLLVFITPHNAMKTEKWNNT